MLFKLILIAVLTLGGLPAAASAFFFRLDGDRLWLQAEQTPLTDILQEFVHAGVDVRLEAWDDMVHVWHIFAPMLPEGQQAIERVGAFLTRTARMLGLERLYAALAPEPEPPERERGYER